MRTTALTQLKQQVSALQKEFDRLGSEATERTLSLLRYRSIMLVFLFLFYFGLFLF